jgi:hypothetical protein
MPVGPTHLTAPTESHLALRAGHHVLVLLAKSMLRCDHECSAHWHTFGNSRRRSWRSRKHVMRQQPLMSSERSEPAAQGASARARRPSSVSAWGSTVSCLRSAPREPAPRLLVLGGFFQSTPPRHTTQDRRNQRSAPHLDAEETQPLQPRGLGLQSKRLLIESQWVSKPLAFAGKMRPRRLNN